MSHSKLARTAILVVLNVAIYFFIGKWLYENVRPATFAAQLGEMSPWAALSVVLVNLLGTVAYARRMGILLRREFATGWQVVILGFGLNSVLPFRLGEPAKIYYAHSILALSPLQLAEATFMEKYIDLVCVAALLALAMSVSVQHILQPSLLWWTVAVLAIATIVILMFDRGVSALEKLTSGTGKFRSLIQAAKTIGRGYQLWRILAATAVIWTFNVTLVYFAFNALLPAAEVRPSDAVTLVVICALSVAIPAAPAGLGLFEAGIVAYLTGVLRVDNEIALAVAVVFHLAVILPQLAIMLGLIVRHHYVQRSSGHDGDAKKAAPPSRARVP